MGYKKILVTFFLQMFIKSCQHKLRCCLQNKSYEIKNWFLAEQ